MPKMISLILAFALSPLLVACIQTVLSLEETASNQPTVGFSLTVDRVIASVRWNNVLTEDLVELKASEEYIELMRHFSSPSSQHPRYDEHHNITRDRHSHSN